MTVASLSRRDQSLLILQHGKILPMIVYFFPVLGASIELLGNPKQDRLSGHSLNTVVHQEIHKLLQKRVLIEAKSSPSQIVSGIFLLPKKDGTNRFILNLKSFNEFVTHHRFKINSLTIIKVVTPTCFMASIDMKDAHYSIPLKSEDRKTLVFAP